MEKLTLAEIVSAVRGSYGYPADTLVSGISTDTRTITENSVFIAIKGERFDGHDYAVKAMEQGAAAVITERPVEGARCIITDSTRQALLDVAGYYRRKLGIPIVGITGSVGKTTTKEMIALVLGAKYKTLKTRANLNNEIGMPQTLLELDSSYGAAVIEMGMNHKGEISRMSMSCKPDICVITNVGVSHIENLGSREGILKAKLEILDGTDRMAPLVMNLDNDMLAQAEIYGDRPVYMYSVRDPKAYVHTKGITNQGDRVGFTVVSPKGEQPVTLNCPGEHNVSNALAAFTVGLLMDLDTQTIANALAAYKPEGMRQNLISRDGVTVILDCYNAAPDSMRASFDILGGLQITGTRWCVLADMLELGERSPEFHRQVGEMLPVSKADRLLCCGEQSWEYIKGAVSKGFPRENAGHFDSPKEIAEHLKGKLAPGDALLLKGSRGMKLEGVYTELFGPLTDGH